MINLNIKPLSVNEVWQGKRFKTKRYSLYEAQMMLILPNLDIPEGKLSVFIQYGFSSIAADIDNPCKPFLDCLQKRYGFDDKRIFELRQVKTIVKKGNEFIKFEIKPYLEIFN